MNEQHDDRTIVEHFGDLTRDFQLHRETVNRAIGLLAAELFEIRDALKLDAQARTARQQELDRILGRITAWQRWRLVADMMLIVVIAAFLIGLWFF